MLFRSSDICATTVGTLPSSSIFAFMTTSLGNPTYTPDTNPSTTLGQDPRPSAPLPHVPRPSAANFVPPLFPTTYCTTLGFPPCSSAALVGIASFLNTPRYPFYLPPPPATIVVANPFVVTVAIGQAMAEQLVPLCTRYK